MPAPLQAGTVLIASLDLEDANFLRTVVLLIQHSEGEGTLGLVLNRPLGDKVSLYSGEELHRLAGIFNAGEDASSDELGRVFFQGGPVEPGYLFFLHRLDGLITAGTPVCPGVFLGGDLDAVRTQAQGGHQPGLRFYLGYAGWREGQLEAEIAIGAWYLCPATPELVFDDQPAGMWQRAMYSLGGRYRVLSMVPETTGLN